jgi:hypothetical protein
MNLSAGKTLKLLAASLMLGSCEPTNKETELSTPRLPDIKAEVAVADLTDTNLQTSKSILSISKLTALGYRFDIQHGILIDADRDTTAQEFKALHSLGLKNYSFRTINAYLAHAQQSKFLTRATNLDEAERAVTIPRYTGKLEQANQIEIIDNTNGESISVKIPLAEDDIINFQKLTEKPIPPLPIVAELKLTEALNFTSVEYLRPWNLPAGAEVNLDINALGVSVGEGRSASGNLQFKMQAVAPYHELAAVDGMIDTITLVFESKKTNCPTLFEDGFGNLVTTEFLKDHASSNDEGVVVIKIHPRPYTLFESANNQPGQTALDFSFLKEQFPILKDMVREVSISTKLPKVFKIDQVKVVSLLSSDSEALIGPETLNLAIAQVNKTEALFSCPPGLISELHITDGGLNGDKSFYRPLIGQRTIWISDNHLNDPDLLNSAVQHESIHSIDRFYGLSRSDEFIQLTQDLYKKQSSLLEKLSQQGDHPYTSPEELFETLVNYCLGKRTAIFNSEETSELLKTLTTTRQILLQKLPRNAPIIEVFNQKISALRD